MLAFAAPAMVSSPAGAATFTATSTDGTVFTAPSLQDAEIEATLNNLFEAQDASSGIVTFAGFNQSVCMSAGERYNGDYTTWLGGAATSNCQFNPVTPKTIFCYTKAGKLAKAVIAVDPKCPAGLTTNARKK